jgi:tetratricopeptide (TPR) repeat protein
MAEADPGSRNRALAQIVDTHRAARDYDAARKASQQAYAEFPESRPIAVQRATVLAETGELSEGVKILKKLLTGEPRDREILLTLAQIYEKGKRYVDAVEVIEKAEKLSPTEREKMGVLFSYGSVLERAKRFDQAEAKFRELLKIDPENTATLNYLGYMLADLNKKLDEAHDMVQKALDREPDNGAFLDSLGWVYYRQDKLDLAERYLVRSLEKIKTDPVVRSHLGEVYFKQGKFEKAKEQWELALRDWEKNPEADRDAAEISKLKKKLVDVNAELSSQAQKQGANNP